MRKPTPVSAPVVTGKTKRVAGAKKPKSTATLLKDLSKAAATKAEKPKAAPSKRDDAKKKKRDKVVRDSYTMPKAEFDRIDALKKRCLTLGVAVKKTELLRAGLAALIDLSDDKLVSLVRELAQVKTGRPPADKKQKKHDSAKSKKS